MLKMIKLIIFFIVSGLCECANILAVFPTPSISHQVVFRPLIHELVKRGHNVVLVTPDPAFPKGHAPQNLTEIDVHDISYRVWNKFIETEKGKAADVHQQIIFIYELLAAVFKEQLETEEVKKLIYDKNKKFDLLFVEACVRPALGFSYLYKVPVIEFSSLGGVHATFDIVGVPTQPLIYPLATRHKLYNLSFWETVTELYMQYAIEKSYKLLENSENKILQKAFGKEIPPLEELKKNVQMAFLNTHHIWDSNRPVSPNIIYLGGIHQKPEKALPQDLKRYLDSSKNGVIYFSFGTNVRPSLLPSQTIKIFTNVFSKLPYNILWKWDKDEVPGRPQNVKISKWLPQSDLLRHPNIKLFITQGGLQSTDEAILAGVPLLGIPMLGDQWFNTELYVGNNIGMKLCLETLTEDVLKNAIENIIDNKSYRENIVKLRNVMYDQPQSSLDRAVWWTEHVLRHGGAMHLQSGAANMHWTKYYGLDIILTILIIFISLFISLFYLIRYILLKLKHMRLKTKTN